MSDGRTSTQSVNVEQEWKDICERVNTAMQPVHPIPTIVPRMYLSGDDR